MAALKIALVGAPRTGKSQLAAALTGALKTSGWQAEVVVADTPALPADLARHDLTLLMGLETAETPGSVREAADQSIRAALAHAAVPYQVVYGLDEERLAQALHAIERLRPSTSPGSSKDSGSSGRAWVWMCDKCSDPQCEHRLLTDLLAQRASAV